MAKKAKTMQTDPISWSRSLSRRLLDFVKTGILIADSYGCIRFSSGLALQLLGYARGSLAGKSIDILFLPDDLEFFMPNIIKLTRQGIGYEGEALLARHDGTSLFVNLSTALYSGDDSDQQLLVFAFQDITNLKKMEKAYLGSERFSGLGVMTDQISHQIRNPLACIGGFALRLAKEQLTHNDYVNYSNIIQNEAKRLEYVIDRLAEFAHIHPLRYSTVSLTEILAGVENSFGPCLENSPGRISFPATGSLPETPLFADGRLLVRAIQCVIQNGLEALSCGAAVEVSGGTSSHHVWIRVKDNGDGVPPDCLPFVFDPFFTTKHNYLGLGLTMAKRVIDAHKGHISIDTVEKRGTEVSITIPRERRREIRTRLLP